ncbi:MAG: ABC transporter ATP-binding protein, partial [Pseudoclavibacter sp.]|nr:ABC transporter ATP-binding protein [Pseudoclavibacter sp.]
MNSPHDPVGARPAAEPNEAALEEFERAEAARRQGGGMHDGGMQQGRAKDFWPSFRKLLGVLAPFTGTIALVTAAGAGAVALAVAAPRLLGEATSTIFEGVVSAQLPAGADKQQIVAQLRANGQDSFANMLEAMPIIPGQGVDFERLGSILLAVLAVYIASELLMWLQGYLMNRVMVRALYRLRSRVEDKINRLPLSYFDGVRRGELLSRVTNDIDNLNQALQQSLSSAITSLLTVVGVLVMMFSISWQLALVALVALPLTGVVMGIVGPRSQKSFAEQWARTGRLNGRVEEAFSGHALVRVFGREEETRRVFAEENEALYRASFTAQFLSGTIMPAVMFIGNLSYAGI